MQLDLDPGAAAVDALHDATAIYTRAHVVRGLLDKLGWPDRDLTFLDPAAGDGSFLVTALEQMQLPPGDLSAAQRVQGWEIHPNAAAAARRRVAEHLIRRGWQAIDAKKTAKTMVIHADYLTNDDPRLWDVVAGNPPYLIWRNLPEYFKARYAGILPSYTKADLMHAFLDACARRLAPTGRLGFVTADRWVFNDSAGTFREELGRYVGITHIERLDCASSFYRPKRRRAGTPPRIHPVEVVLRPVGRNVAPLTREPVSIGKAVCGLPHRVLTLGEVADVWLGPWLGPRGVFIVDEETSRGLPGAELVPVIDARRDVALDDQIKPLAREYAIRTSSRIVPPAEVLEHLAAGWERMPRRAQKRRGASARWMPPETITQQLDRPLLMIPRIANRLRVVDVPCGHLPVNHAIVVAARTGGASLTALKAYLLSQEAQNWLTRNAPPLENGFHMITTKIIRSIPVPEQFRPAGGVTANTGQMICAA